MQKGRHPSTMNAVRLQIASGLSVRPSSPRPIRIEKSYGGRPGGDFRHSSFSPTDYASSVSFSSAVGVQEAYSLLFFFFKFELRYQKISCHQDSLQFTLTTSRGKSDRGHSDWWASRSKAHGRVSEPFYRENVARSSKHLNSSSLQFMLRRCSHCNLRHWLNPTFPFRLLRLVTNLGILPSVPARND